MAQKDLPSFVIYQPNPKEFYICLEAKGQLLRWCSLYPPTLDTRYPRQITRIKNTPLQKLPTKGIVDKGTYSLTRSDKRAAIEEKIDKAVKGKSFAFVLNGEKLKGRFIIKQTAAGLVLQKFKDKYAIEEDVLSGDLVRTISALIPDYDESKITLPDPRKSKNAKRRQTNDPEATKQTVKKHKITKASPPEQITSDKEIGGTTYHFTFYNSDSEPELCLVTNHNGKAIILKHDRQQWVTMPTMNDAPLPDDELRITEHAKRLYKMQDKS